MKYESIMRAFSGSVWAILPEKLEAIAALLELRASGSKLSESEVKAATRGTEEIRPVNGKIAVLSIEGTIVQKANLFSEFSGGASTERIGKAFDAAIKDPDVGAVLLAFDSPGGSAYGVPELAAKIYEARGKKPIYAFAGPMACSAAYWIASACDQVIVQPSGDVGSIGVFIVHSESSKLDEKIGVKHSIIKAGRLKTAGNPSEPLADEARDLIQARVDLIYDEFVQAVAKYRGTNPEAVRTGYGEGWLLRGEEAVKAGLADRVATFDEVIAELTATTQKRDQTRAERDYWTNQ